MCMDFATMNGSASGICPGVLVCNDSSPYPVVAYKYMAIPAITSSFLSCIGAAVIIFSFCRWKEIRTGSREIITYLSIADFFTAFGYIIGSLNYALSYQNHHIHSDCGIFKYICEIQSFITTTSSLSSFFWTCCLALYLYLSLVHNKVVLARKIMPIFHIISWGLPLAIVVPVLATRHLGYSYYAASTWCYIKEKDSSSTNMSTIETVLVLVAGKFWEISTYFFVIIFYILIKRHISIQSKKGLNDKSLNAGLVALLRRSDKKLVAIPVLFVLLRMWGTLQFFYSLAVHNHVNENGCTASRGIHNGFIFFGLVQAIGDGGQGWANFILYVIVSEKVRTKLLHCCSRSSSPNTTKKDLEESSSSYPLDRKAINYGSVKETGRKGNKRAAEVQVDFVEPTTT